MIKALRCVNTPTAPIEKSTAPNIKYEFNETMGYYS